MTCRRTNTKRTRNWDNDQRISEQDGQGVVAEVVFPNTVPPFFPSSSLVSRPPTADDYEKRLAGIRAHNRWLAEWCADFPERRAGIGQIFINNIDDALEDIRFIAENGFAGRGSDPRGVGGHGPAGAPPQHL